MRTLFVAIAVAAGALIFNSVAFACPCSPCRCSPCTCGGMNRGNTGSSRPQPARTAPNKTQSGKTERPTTQSKGHQAGKEHGHGHGHSGGASVGGGVNIDLSGIGQRRAEPNPFAVSGPPPPPRTQERPEKPKTKEKQHDITRPDPFSNISLTGPEAKEANEPPGPINISDDNETPPKLPTGEVFKNEKPKQYTMDDLKKAKDAYYAAEKNFLDGDPDYQAAWKQYSANVGTAGPGTLAEKKAQEALTKIRQRKDHFAQSDEGKKLIADWKTAYDNLVNSGEKIEDGLIPLPQNEMEKRKYAVAKAKNDLEFQQNAYELKKQMGGDNWASSDEAKKQMQKIHEAEKQLDKAKEAYKPFEQFEEKPAKAASNP